MMKKRITAAVLAMMMSVSLCACGGSDDPAESGGAGGVTTAAGEDTSSEPTETEAASEASEAEDEGSGNADSSEPADGDELAAVQQVVDKYEKALAAKDYDTLVDVMDIELLYFLSEGKTGDREAYKTYIKENVVDEGTDYSGYEFSEVYSEEGYVAEYEEFFKMMEEESEEDISVTDNFKIDRAYAFKMKAPGINIEIPVIHINDEWKCDPDVSMMMSFYNMFSDIADDTSSAAAEE